MDVCRQISIGELPKSAVCRTAVMLYALATRWMRAAEAGGDAASQIATA